MKLTLRRCHTCRALGVGPNKIKLWPFEGRLYCKEDYKLALTWEESRDGVVRGITSIKEFDEAVRRLPKRRGAVLKGACQQWLPYIHELAGLAGWALMIGDRRTFVHYFSRAVWAWALKENQDAVK